MATKKCSICNKKAVEFVRWKNKHYCKKHFNEYVEGQIRKIFDKHKISFDKKICVAISGGKDSTCMLYILKKFCKNFEALYINLGIGKYSENALKKCEKICKSLDIKLNVINVKKIIGTSMESIFKKSKKKECKICGIVKRYLLNEFAFKNNFEILATGQNMDDMAAHTINTLKSGYLLGLKGFTPFLKKEDKFVAVLKPLFFLSEKEIEKYLEINKIPFLKEKCPYSEKAPVPRIKKALQSIENEKPGFLRAFVSSLVQLSKIVKIEIKFKRCKICDFPCLKEICSFCEIKRKFK